MRYPIDTPAQLRAILKALRKSRGLSQAALGAKLGVNQKRIARIEASPEVTGLDQISRLVAALGGRLVIEDLQAPSADTKATPKKSQENW